MKKIIVAIMMCVFLAGCASCGNPLKAIIGNSTSEVEEWRGDAEVKVFDYDYATCYAKMEEVLKKMPHVSIYARNATMIAVFYINPDTTPVGIFFTNLGNNRTQVEVSSPSTISKLWIAQNIFSETVLPPENPVMKLEKSTTTKKTVL